MDSNNSFPVSSAPKSSVTQVYNNSFHQALSLRPAVVAVSGEMDDRDLFLMAQMHAPWMRATFTEGAPPDQPSASSNMYAAHNHNMFPSDMSANPPQPQPPPLPIQLPDLQPPVHHQHQHQRQRFPTVPQEQQHQQQQAVPKAATVVSQSTAEPVENSMSGADDQNKQTPRKRKRSSNLEQTEKKLKRSSNPAEWKKKKKKIQRDKGEEYVTMRGKVHKARSVQPIDCSKCRFRCSEKIPEETRQAIHKVYWNLASYERQRAFIAQHVEQNDIKQVKSKTSARREVAHSFFFVHKRKEHRVCKAFFTKTLDITNKVVDYTMKRTECGVYVGQDERGRRDPVNKTKPEDSEFIRWHISSFPTVDSSKGKKADNKNKKRYLSHDLNVGKMYAMYKELCEQTGRKAMGISVYRNIFNQNFNLAFQKPKKEHCANCKCGDGNKKKVKDTCSSSSKTVSNMPSTSAPEQPAFFHSSNANFGS